MIHVVLRAFLRRLGYRPLGLALSSDEQQPPALGHGFANRIQRGVKHRHGLRQVDYVNAVPVPVDEFRHQGIPSLSLVAEMHARFQ